MTEHRVPMLRPTLRRFQDPTTSADPRVRAVLLGLRELDYAPPPRQEFRDELRAQLVAISARIVNEERPEAVTPASDGSTPAHALRRRSAALARPLRIAATAAAVLVLLLGGTVWLSQKALPGDSLYGLKRSSEDVRLHFTSGTDRGHYYLKLAQTRVQEAQDLAGRDSASAAGGGVLAGGVSAHTTTLITSTLASADKDLQSGWTQLANLATSSRSPAPLKIMRDWAPGQQTRLEQLRRSVPAGALRAATNTSLSWVAFAIDHANSLSRQVAAGSRDAGTSTPASHRPAAKTPKPSRATPAGVAPGHAAPGRAAPGHRATSAPRSTARPRSHVRGTHAASASATPTPRVPVKLPKVAVPSVGLGTCGVSVSAGPLHVHVGQCPSHS